MTGFQVVPLRRIFRVVNGGTPTSDPANWNGDIPWATPVDLGAASGAVSRTQRTLTAAGAINGSRIVPRNSLILSTRAPIGYVAVNNVDVAFNQGCRALVPHAAEVDIRYFYYYLLAATSELRSRGQGSTFQELSSDALAAMPVHLPRPEEQRRIADFLDAASVHSRRLSGRLSETLALLDERDSSSLAISFDPRALPRKATADRAEILQLRRVVSRWVDYRGATPTKAVSGIPLVTARNIKNGRINLDIAPEFIAEEDYGPWMRRGLPEAGDILLTTEAPLGEVARIVDPGVALAQRIILIKVDSSRISAEWVYWYLRSPTGQRELWSRATGSTAPGIKADRLKGVPIPVMGQDAMRRRLGWLETGLHETDRLRRPINRQLDLLAERHLALITAAVTGQIDVTTARGVG